MKPLCPPHIADLTPYPPGKPIDEVKRELGIPGEVIKLASNENAFGPSPLAVEAATAALRDVHRYPDGGAFHLKEALSEKLGVSADRVVLGNGSNELIELIVRAFVLDGEDAVISGTTFVIYKLVLRGAGRAFTEVPLNGYDCDLDAMAAAVGDRTKLIFIASPNNPTGKHTGKEALADLLARISPDVLVVMDEAYGEFASAADYPDTVALQESRPRLITLRTFSKAYGLAGLRCGYGIASPEIVGLLNRLRQPFNSSSPAQAAALAALGDTDHLEHSLRATRQGLARLASRLSDLGLRPVESQANFVLVDMGRPARPIFEALLQRGVIVRAMDAYALPHHLRITVGTPAENDCCLSELEQVL